MIDTFALAAEENVHFLAVLADFGAMLRMGNQEITEVLPLKLYSPEELDAIEELSLGSHSPSETLALLKAIPTLVAMARQLAAVTDEYETVYRECDITNGTYELNRRRKNCICLGYRDANRQPARDPQCRAHGEITE